MSNYHIRVSEPSIGLAEQQAVAAVMQSGWLTYGPRVQEFEKRFARYVGTQYALATSSGTTALHLALAALDIQPGDEVLVPNITFVATANAVRYCGGVPVFVDVDRYTWTMDTAMVERAITPKTVGMIPVHLFGKPCYVHALQQIASHYRLWLVEDACQALGAVVGQQQVGSFGRAGVFSFYGNKTITTGEGGMVVTHDEELAKKVYSLRGQAQHPNIRYYHQTVGYNYRMTDIAAAIGLAQLRRLEEFISKRWSVFGSYHEMLGALGSQPTYDHHAAPDHGVWMFTALFPTREDRIRAQQALDSAGIEARPVFTPMSLLPMYASSQGFPVSFDLRDRGLCLPTHVNLTVSDQEQVCEVIKKALKAGVGNTTIITSV